MSGLPRSSGDEAFSALAHEEASADIKSAAVLARATPWKSRSTAAQWSLVPGLGQIYVGETASGIANERVSSRFEDDHPDVP